MVVNLLRTRTGPHGTFGVLIAPGFYCRTIELPWRDNKPFISCIPVGLYECIWSYSRTFRKYLYLLLNVPGRSGVRIHSGNYAGDKSKRLKTHSLGCILPGKYDGWLGNQQAVLCSRFALSDFYRIVNKQSFTLNIKELYR